METGFKKIVGHRLQMYFVWEKILLKNKWEKRNLSTSAYCKIVEYGETDLTLTKAEQNSRC